MVLAAGCRVQRNAFCVARSWNTSSTLRASWSWPISPPKCARVVAVRLGPLLVPWTGWSYATDMTRSSPKILLREFPTLTRRKTQDVAHRLFTWDFLSSACIHLNAWVFYKRLIGLLFFFNTWDTKKTRIREWKATQLKYIRISVWKVGIISSQLN